MSRKNQPTGMVCARCGLEVMKYFSGWRHLRNQYSRPSCGLPAAPESVAATTAWKRGFEAFGRNCDVRHNPYPYRSYRKQWTDWRAGWVEARNREFGPR